MSELEKKLVEEIMELKTALEIKNFREKNAEILASNGFLDSLVTGRISVMAGFYGDRAMKSAERAEITAGERAGKLLADFRRKAIVTSAINGALAKLREVSALPFAGTIVVRFESHGTGSKAVNVKPDAFIVANIPEAEKEAYVSHPEVTISFRSASTDETGKIIKRKREKISEAEKLAKRKAERKARLAETYAKRIAKIDAN